MVAIKSLKKKFENFEEVKRQREVQAHLKLKRHPNIMELIEILYHSKKQRIGLVFDLMDQNLFELVINKSQKNLLYFKFILFEVLKGIYYLHSRGIFHRDIKPENILIQGSSVKLGDFGCCKGVYADQPFTEYISTRWYRSPECLLTDGYYEPKIDIWAFGCVVYEAVVGDPLFMGDNELD